MAGQLTVQITMLGGRRAGKTSALAAMCSCFGKEFRGTQFSIVPANDDAQAAVGAKLQEMKNYLTKASMNENFVPSGELTQGDKTYRFNLRLKNRPDTIHLDFYDYPGEWLDTGNPNYNNLIEKVASSDVVLIIIDTPYLMENGGQYNDVRNRCLRITSMFQLIEDLKIKIVPKLVLFVPIKCEKYCHENHKMIDVNKEILRYDPQHYGPLVEYLQGSCEMAITPIQTIGTAEFIGFDFDEKTGDMLMVKHDECGEYPNKPLYAFTELAEAVAKQQGSDLKFADDPKYCEQPAVYTLYYVLTYAAKVAQMKKAANKKKFIKVFGAKFGVAALRFMKGLIPAPIMEVLPEDKLNKLIKNLCDRFDFASAEDFLKQRDLVFKKMKASGDGYEIIHPDILDFKGERK